MAFTQETLPKTPEEAGEIMAVELLENFEEYRQGERDSFYAVFCPGSGKTPIHDVGLHRFLDGLPIASIEAGDGYLLLENGEKLYYDELRDPSNDGKPYQVTFSTEPVII